MFFVLESFGPASAVILLLDVLVVAIAVVVMDRARGRQRFLPCP